MRTRREIERTLGLCVLSGLLSIAACEGKPAGNDPETVGEMTAALTAAKPLARGLVRNGAGAPIARARVDVRGAGSTRIIACVHTAADGTFPLNVRAGTYDLTVTPRVARSSSWVSEANPVMDLIMRGPRPQASGPRAGQGKSCSRCRLQASVKSATEARPPHGARPSIAGHRVWHRRRRGP